MRRILLFCLLLTGFGLSAQTTVQHPFPTDSAAWYESSYYSHDNLISVSSCVTKYYFNGDSTINNIQYKNIAASSLCYCIFNGVIDNPCNNGNGPFYHDEPATGILLRTDSNKVYVKEGSNQEFILYDYTLQVNDSFTIVTPWPGHTLRFSCAIIDSALTNTGYRKQWNLISINGNDTLKWIEGATSNMGLFYHNSLSDWYTVDYANDELTVCFMHNDTFVLGGGLESCEALIAVGINENPTQPQSTIYPNPATNEFTVMLGNTSQKLTITLYNLTGQQVATYSAGGKQIIIPRANLPSGMYLLQIDADNKQSYHKVIIH